MAQNMMVKYNIKKIVHLVYILLLFETVTFISLIMST